jgi:hypothetical protein
MLPASPRIFAMATKGTGTNEEDRLRVLLSRTNAQFLAFDKKAKKKSFIAVLKRIFRERPDLLVMEGSGLAGGLVCILARIFGRTRYVVSSGDAVGPFVGAHSALAGPVFAIYERLLCRWSDGFIGWTPYLTGRAMTFGAPRGVTACGFAPRPLSPSPGTAGASSIAGRGEDNFELRESLDAPNQPQPHSLPDTVPLPHPNPHHEYRERGPEGIRTQIGIPASAVVFGIAGALVWNPRRGYCYGQELVEAICKTSRPDLCVLIVGGGTGLDRLKQIAGDRVGKSVFFTDMVPGLEVAKYLAAMDVASLPQSRDGVGMFRYTTKISEYAAAGLPIVTGRLPLAYDLDDGTMWRLPGLAPWSPEYVDAMAELMQHLTAADAAAIKSKVNRVRPEFDESMQVDRVTRFIDDLLLELPQKKHHSSEVAQTSGQFIHPAAEGGLPR